MLTLPFYTRQITLRYMVKIPKENVQPQGAIPRHFNGLLRDSFDHYSATIPEKFSFLWRLISRFLFRKIKLRDSDAEKISALSKKGAIIYVIRNRSRLEYLMLYHLFKKRGLPPPVFSHYISLYHWQSITGTIRRTLAILISLFEGHGYPNPYKGGFVRSLFTDSQATLLPAKHFRGLPLRFGKMKRDPLADIIEIQEKIKHPIYLVPIEIIYGRRPDREIRGITDLAIGTKESPGRLRLTMMFLRNLKETNILVTDPMSLEEEVDEASILAPETHHRNAEMAYMIRTRCIDRLNRERRVLLGPVLKSRTEMIEQILHDREFFNFLQNLSKNDQKDFIALRRDARKILEEIAADYSHTKVAFITWILKRVFSRLYAEMKINDDALNRVREMAREMPVVYIPCHKSHMDYLVLSYMLYRHNMSLPYIVSGVNLNFWPIGGLFRGGGAFFMRRTFKGKRLYSKVFSKYVEYLVREGIPIEFFIEGSRSRTGKIILPRLGFLSIMLQAVRASGKKNLCIVPVSINYEHIWEQKFYLDEAMGKNKEGENLGTMIRNREMINKKQGRMYLELAEPFTLAEVLRKSRGRIPPEREQVMELAGTIAYRVSHLLNKHSLVTPYALLASVLLSQTARGISMEKIHQGIKLLLGYLRSTGVRIEGLTSGWAETALETMVKEKIISPDTDVDEGGEEENFYFIEDDKRIYLTIYKNSIVHHYQVVALVSMTLLAAPVIVDRHALFDQFRFLKDMLSGELIYSDRKHQTPVMDGQDFEKALEFFSGHGYLSIGEGTLTLEKSGRKAARLFAGSLMDFVDSYYIVAKTMLKFNKTGVSEKTWTKNAMKIGKRLHSTGEIRHVEAVHKNILENALTYMHRMEICEYWDNPDEKGKRTRFYKVKDLVKLRELIERIKPLLEG